MEKALQPRQTASITGQKTARSVRKESGLMCPNSHIMRGKLSGVRSRPHSLRFLDRLFDTETGQSSPRCRWLRLTPFYKTHGCRGPMPLFTGDPGPKKKRPPQMRWPPGFHKASIRGPLMDPSGAIKPLRCLPPVGPSGPV